LQGLQWVRQEAGRVTGALGGGRAALAS
jgi:hypothetical protein